VAQWWNMQFRRSIRSVPYLRSLGISIMAASCAYSVIHFSVLLADPTPDPDPVLASIKSADPSLVFVGSAAYSERDGIANHGFTSLPLAATIEVGRAYIFIAPRPGKPSDHGIMDAHSIMKALQVRNIAATFVGPPIQATVGGPFYTLEFSYDGHVGKIFNSPDASVSDDATMSDKWRAESIAVLYSK